MKLLTLSLVLASWLAGAEPISRKTMGLALARELTMAAEAEARKNNWNVVIVVTDETGHLVTLARMDDTQYGSIAVAQKKARTAAKFRRSTRVFNDRALKGDPAVLSVPDVIAIPGGLPLLVDGKVIGAIGVSGVTSDQDEQIANAAVAALNKR
jgi:glc operon protein GlcG